MKRNILLLTLLMLVSAFSFAPVMAVCSPVEIWKVPHCWADPGDTMYSDNPPYYVGMKYYWWIKITVHANEDLSSVIVYDRFGAELMIEGISLDTPKYDPYDYDFTYTPYEQDGGVAVTGLDSASGNLDKDGVTFDGFTVYWTGKSVKVHFMWNVGPMSAGQTKIIYVTVSTDTNPAGHQEYTSPGCYELNSGATVKAILASTGKQVSAVAPSIVISVSNPIV